MGGTNEFHQDGLRIHENNGEIHIHDDTKGFKFSMPVKDFRSKYDTLKKDLEDGHNKSIDLEDKNGTILMATLDDSVHPNKVRWTIDRPIIGLEQFDELLAKV